MSFKDNLLRGLGKCYIDILNSSDVSIYKEDVLFACLNNISYNPLFEGTKSWYIYNLISCFEDKIFFENKIIEKLDNTPKLSITLYNHLTDLLFEFAINGSKSAKKVLDKEYAKLLAKKRFSKNDYEKLCNLIYIFDDLYKTNRLYKIIDDLSIYKQKHKSFDITNVWCLEAFSYRKGAKYAEKIKNLFPEIDLKSIQHNGYERIDNVTIADIKNACNKDVAKYARCLKKEFHNELVDYIISLDDEKRVIGILNNIHICKNVFDKRADELLNLLKKCDGLIKLKYCQILSKYKNNKIRLYAYELLKDKLTKDLGLELLISNYKEEDEEYLFNTFKKVRFGFKNNDWHSYVFSLKQYFDNKGNNSKIESLLIYYYENSYCSYCREDLVKIMYRYDSITEDIINKLQYDSNYNIRKFASKIKK